MGASNGALRKGPPFHGSRSSREINRAYAQGGVLLKGAL